MINKTSKFIWYCSFFKSLSINEKIGNIKEKIKWDYLYIYIFSNNLEKWKILRLFWCFLPYFWTSWQSALKLRILILYNILIILLQINTQQTQYLLFLLNYFAKMAPLTSLVLDMRKRVICLSLRICAPTGLKIDNVFCESQLWRPCQQS